MNQVATISNNQISVQEKEEFELIEQVVMQGDLSKLNPKQRVMYYNKVCESTGLNPLTRPFDYINLNGKLTLYARKDATEQLRQLKGISITKLESRIVEDLYIVTATAVTSDGRQDQSTGAVSLGTLKGEQRANSIMKCETKAKRRVTLSIAGMGFCDESEVDTIPGAQRAAVNMETGELALPESQKIHPLSLDAPQMKIVISDEEAKEITDLLKTCDDAFNDRTVSYLEKAKIDDVSRLTPKMYVILKGNIMKHLQEKALPYPIVEE